MRARVHVRARAGVVSVEDKGQQTKTGPLFRSEISSPFRQSGKCLVEALPSLAVQAHARALGVRTILFFLAIVYRYRPVAPVMTLEFAAAELGPVVSPHMQVVTAFWRQRYFLVPSAVPGDQHYFWHYCFRALHCYLRQNYLWASTACMPAQPLLLCQQIFFVPLPRFSILDV